MGIGRLNRKEIKMVRTVKIQDNDVKELLNILDKRARKFYSGKYGLPRNYNHEFVMAVYEWIDKKGVMSRYTNGGGNIFDK
jgi:hypothetical protein